MSLFDQIRLDAETGQLHHPIHSSFHRACLLGCIDSFQYLVSHGHDIHQTINQGMTPLHYAAMGGRDQIARLLLDMGARHEADM
jgi:ankyrin repeat protein